MKIEAREKLATRNIKWVEAYTSKTLFLKRMYEDIIGDGCYIRYEGKDQDSDDEYYVILGPAGIHKPRAKFFAGVRKMPATYSAGGKYFDSMDGANTYAKNTWGIPDNKKVRPYTSSSLFGLKEKIDEWKSNEREMVEKGEYDKDEEVKKVYTQAFENLIKVASQTYMKGDLEKADQIYEFLKRYEGKI